MKKSILILFSLSLLISGCSAEKQNNNKPVVTKSNNVVDDNKENNESTENKENKKELESNLNQEVKHDFDAIKDLAKQHVTLSYDNIDIKGPYSNVPRYLPPGIWGMQYYSKEIKKLKNYSFAAPLYDFVDYFNIYNKNTYSEGDVLKIFKDILDKNPDVSYEELDESFSEKTESEIDEITANTNFVKYYKKDKMIVYQIVGGVGGTYIEKISPEEYWKIEGDKVTVPFINPTNKAINYSVVLKVNNKNYTGGKNKSKYYFYDMIYYN